jgi:hypothetical protein
VRVQHPPEPPGKPKEKKPPAPRGIIRSFSNASRRRLLRTFGTIDTRDVPPPLFAALTYHNEWPDEHGCKKHLDIFIKRWEKRWGETPIVWKMEYQGRGAPHFHLLALCGELDEAALCIRTLWIARNWNEIAAPGDMEHYRVHAYMGPNRQRRAVQICRSWGEASAYAAKYLGKWVEPTDTYPVNVGRFWGVRRPKLLPITAVVQAVKYRAARAIQRILARKRGAARVAKGLPRRYSRKRRSGCARRKRAKDPPGFDIWNAVAVKHPYQSARQGQHGVMPEADVERCLRLLEVLEGGAGGVPWAGGLPIAWYRNRSLR